MSLEPLSFGEPSKTTGFETESIIGERRDDAGKTFISGVLVFALLSYFPAILSYYRIFYILISLVCCIVLYSTQLRDTAKRQMFLSSRYVVGFFAYLALTAVWAQFPGRTLGSVAIDLIFVLIWGLFFVLELTYKEEELARIFIYVPYAVAVTFVYLLAKYGALRPFDEASAEEIGATANLCGQWLVISLPFIYWLIRRGDKRRYLELCLTLFLIAIAQSRTAYLLALFFFAAETFLYGKGARHFFVEGAKLAAVLVFLLTAAWSLPVTRPLVVDGLERVVTIKTDDNMDVDVEREVMFLAGWEAFTEHPWLGIGYHNLGERIGEIFPREIESHNIFVTLISECGWPGFIFFCLLLFEFFKRTKWARVNRPVESRGFYIACQVSLISALLSGMALPLLEFPLFYAVLGLGYASTAKKMTAETTLSQNTSNATC
jgi:O-Antigen ligase